MYQYFIFKHLKLYVLLYNINVTKYILLYYIQ